MEKQLYRAREGKWLAGVCAGMATYMNLPPVVVRLIFVAMGLFCGGGVLMYILGIFIIPKEPLETDSPEDYVDLDEEKDNQ